MRARAIWKALFHGFVPWRFYERQCHYTGMNYWQHLRQNLAYAWTWLRGQEDAVDRAFERRINGS